VARQELRKMSNTYGFEIEFSFGTKEELARYLNNRGNLLSNNFGCDGAGIFTGEIRSAIFEDKELFITALDDYLKLLIKTNCKIFPVCINDLSGKPALYPLGFHLSIGIFNFSVFWKAFKRYLFYKFMWKDSLYKIRSKYYSEMLRFHPERIEFRFIPNYPDIILKEVKYIIGD
jgi:hypothetical protein